MRHIIYCAMFLLSFACIIPLSAGVKQVKIADRKISGFTQSKRLILDDGNVYKPISNKTEASTWDVGDAILVLRGRDRNRFTLVNTRTGTKAKVMIVSL